MADDSHRDRDEQGRARNARTRWAARCPAGRPVSHRGQRTAYLPATRRSRQPEICSTDADHFRPTKSLKRPGRSPQPTAVVVAGTGPAGCRRDPRRPRQRTRRYRPSQARAASTTVTSRLGLAGSRRDLQADPAPTDHHQPRPRRTRSSSQHPAQGLAVLGSPQGVHAGRVEARQRPPARARAGGQQQPVVAHRRGAVDRRAKLGEFVITLEKHSDIMQAGTRTCRSPRVWLAAMALRRRTVGAHHMRRFSSEFHFWLTRIGRRCCTCVLIFSCSWASSS